jgi:hypothetical protein
VKREGLAAVPLCVTDKTSVAVFGVPWRTLRAWLDAAGIPYTKIGRRPIVRVDRVLDAIDRMSGAAPRDDWSEQAVVDRIAAGRRR